MSDVSPEDLLLLGKVIRPHGLEGVMRIQSFDQPEHSFLKARTLFLKLGAEEIHAHSVLSVKPHKNIFLLKLKGLNSLEDAEKYRGAEILVKKEVLVREDSDEFFWYELIGLKVYLDTGQYIGSIRHILPTGSNDIYVIRDGESEVLIPAIHDVVKEIDLEKGRMIITPLEGLLNL